MPKFAIRRLPIRILQSLTAVYSVAASGKPHGDKEESSTQFLVAIGAHLLNPADAASTKQGCEMRPCTHTGLIPHGYKEAGGDLPCTVTMPLLRS